MKKVIEPKIIKEETSESKESAGGTFTETPKTRSKVNRETRCKTPDSPEGARQTPHSPNQSNQTNNPPSPLNGSSNECLTPPLPATTALEGVHLQHSSHGNFSNVGRPTLKVKKFLGTLVQFGNEIGTDIGERVRSLILNLVSSNLSIEEFHHSLQDVTNFPLRPFVFPFLRTHLPLLQREIHALARSAKQSALQYVRNHEYVVLDPSSNSSTELSEIFMPNESTGFATSGIKRKAESLYENGYGNHPSPDDSYLPKRIITQNPFYFTTTTHHNLMNIPHFQNTFNQPQLFDYPNQLNKIEDSNNNNNNNRVDEEWKNIHVMLNCILSMVEKTKRALTILQQRNSQDLTNEWFRKQDLSVDLKKAANEIMIQAVRQTEDRVAEVKKRAEDAVNDVKRQAVLDLQKAVAVAEAKANELIAIEKAKVEKLLNESRKSEENSTSASQLENNNAENLSSLSPPVLTQPAPSQQNACWNCGRKAHETCSGCGIARYCGSFCQHKDWENHHQLCSKEKLLNTRSSIRSATPNSTTNNHNIPTNQLMDNQTTNSSKFKK